MKEGVIALRFALFSALVAACSPAPKPLPTPAAKPDPDTLCSNVAVPQQALCDCVNASFQTELFDCEPLASAGPFRVLDTGTQIVATLDRDGAQIVLGSLLSLGSEHLVVEGMRAVELGGRQAVWIDAWISRSDSELANQWVFLCPAREPGTVDWPRCLSVLVKSVWRDHDPETRELRGPVHTSRLDIRITPEGDINVTAHGRVADRGQRGMLDPQQQKLIGTHRLE